MRVKPPETFPIPPREVRPLKAKTALIAMGKLVSLGFAALWLRNPTKSLRRTPEGDRELPPERRGKAPVQEGWKSLPCLGYDELAEQWGQGGDEPGYNLGIRTGFVEGANFCVVVVDLDTEEALAWARENLPETQIRVRTRSGEHWYYRRPPTPVGNRVKVVLGGDSSCTHGKWKGKEGEKVWKCECGAVRLDLDVKGDGGLVVGPASVHGTGVQYRATLPWTPERVDSVPLFDPAWFGSSLWEGMEEDKDANEERRPPVYVDAGVRRRRALAYLEACPGTVSGQGTASADCLYYARALVRGLCLPPEEAARLMVRHEWNRRCLDSHGLPYPWSQEELLHKARDAWRLKFDKPYGWMLAEEKKASDEAPERPSPDALEAEARESAAAEEASVWWDFEVEETPVDDPGGRKWPLTDTGNAERLVARFGEGVRWVEDREVWFVWDGKAGRWLPRPVALDRCSKTVARKIGEEVGPYEEAVEDAEAALAPLKERTPEHDKAKTALDRAEKALKSLRGWQMASESAGHRRAMIQMAQSEPTVAVGSDSFDRHPYLLNCKNGTLDLRTGLLMPFDRDLYLTKACLVDWDPDAEAPTWERCLRQWTAGDEEIVAFLRRAAGYTLTGSTEEECIFILTGNGQNGKSTFLNALQAVMGPYAITAPAGLLMETRVDKATPGQQAGLAAMVGARLVVCSETDDSAHMSEAQVKAIACRDRISAKRMYEAPFDFKPSHKGWLTTNHKPGISGTDDGIWRRIHLVEWLTRVADGERDNHLAEKLLAERSGILRWAALGCAEWMKTGLNPPEVVRSALRAYREQQDTVGSFLMEVVELVANETVQKAQLRQAYEVWCEQEGHKPFGAKRFAQELMQRGVKDERTSSSRLWRGLRFRK